jgi:two-component system cell cycle sensor histidine kinase/response regulator CckA
MSEPAIAPLRVLLVEDSATDAKLVVQALRQTGRTIECTRVETADAMRSALELEAWDCVISDWSMPKFSAAAALAILKEQQLDLPFIIVSGTIGEDSAVEAMRAGAHDYVLKDKLGRLLPAIERELRECSGRAAHRRAENALLQSDTGLKQAEAGRTRAEEALEQREQQLRQAQKMEAIGRLAGGVAHDFNNMLSVILSYGELVLEGLESADPLRADMEEIRTAAMRAAGLTHQLLMFSRQQVFEPKVIDLREVLTSMDKMLQRILGEDVELVSIAASEARVRVDPTHIEQVILNLAVNARDAMPTGGKLTIETANVVLDEEYALSHLATNAGPHVMLAVSDTGSGMDRETQARIFEPFFTTKEPGKGTGLGLSTVFGIVQQSGGNIWVYSELGKGTTFKVYLPRVDAELDRPTPLVAKAKLRGAETILLVEDDEQVRTIVLSILRRQGYQVLAAQRADEALLFDEQHSAAIDLLLTDVVMPQMSGPELAKRLLLTRPRMRVLYMSGYTDDSIVRHGVLNEGVAFLQKPVTPASIARKVREVLDQEHQLDQEDGHVHEPAAIQPDSAPLEHAIRVSVPPDTGPRVLVVDDDDALLRAHARALVLGGYQVITAVNGAEAIHAISEQSFDVILSDIDMPGMSGITLLERVRTYDLDVPVVLITGAPSLETAMKAMECGALRYLTKPIDLQSLVKVADDAFRLHRIAKAKRQALELAGGADRFIGDQAGLVARFAGALESLYIVYQPVVSSSNRTVFAYEALLRTNEPSLPHPGAVIDAAERLDGVHVLGRKIRAKAVEPLGQLPDEIVLFLNLHPRDLLDDELFNAHTALAAVANRVVLEITERESLACISDVQARVASLRELGFRIAIDDFGAGYAGLTSFTLLQPDIVKLDMALVRDLHREPRKQTLVRTIISMCKELGILVTGEGIEVQEEREELERAGCDLMQGYLFAKPGAAFPIPTFEAASGGS